MELTIDINYRGLAPAGAARITRTVEGFSPGEITLAAAKAVTSWVKTDANTAAGNLPAGHGLSNGTFDVYWPGGCRYGVTATIATNALSLDGGAGDDFPASATEDVTCAPQQEVTFPVVGDDLAALILHASALAHVDLQGSDDTSHLAALLDDNESLTWVAGLGLANPIVGDTVTKAMVSSGSTSGGTLKLLAPQDITP